MRQGISILLGEKKLREIGKEIYEGWNRDTLTSCLRKMEMQYTAGIIQSGKSFAK